MPARYVESPICVECLRFRGVLTLHARHAACTIHATTFKTRLIVGEILWGGRQLKWSTVPTSGLSKWRLMHFNSSSPSSDTLIELVQTNQMAALRSRFSALALLMVRLRNQLHLYHQKVRW